MHNSSRQGIAIGFFDGVHLGHQRILADAKVAITFRNHPLSVLAPEKAPRLIMPFKEREAMIRSCGVENVAALDFTEEFAATEPEDFARRYLTEPTIFCGGNWRFGRANRGNPILLESLGYDVRIAPFAVFKGERISSSRIRAAIENGNIEDANAMLGRPWSVAGRVVVGKGLGRKIGFPTINLVLDDLRLNLPRGVYVVNANGVRGVANWGIAPTMRENAWRRNTLEVHMIGVSSFEFRVSSGEERVSSFEFRVSSGEGREASGEADVSRVEFLRFLRPEKTFENIEALQTQIAADIKSAMQ